MILEDEAMLPTHSTHLSMGFENQPQSSKQNRFVYLQPPPTYSYLLQKGQLSLIQVSSDVQVLDNKVSVVP